MINILLKIERYLRKYLYVPFLLSFSKLAFADGLADMFKKLREQAVSIGKDFKIILITVGIFLVASGLFSLYRKSRHPEAMNISAGAALGTIIIGVLMSAIGTVMVVAGQTVGIETQID